MRTCGMSALALVLTVALGAAACSGSGKSTDGATTVARPARTTTASASPSASHAEPTVTIAAVGDTMLGNTPDLPPDPQGYFRAVRRELNHGAQIVFGNLEGTLTTAAGSK